MTYGVRGLCSLGLVIVLSACTYVKVTDAGAQVRQASAEDVQNCRALGEVASATQDRVLLKRPDGKVRQELIDLARNQAASMGANAIVPKAEHSEGNQVFIAYACDEDS